MFNFHPRLMDDLVTVKLLDKLSKEINAGEWKRLGRNLGIDDYELEAIEHDNLVYGLRECCYQMLLKWNRTSKKPATKKQLIKALHDMNRNDLALKLKSDTYAGEKHEHQHEQYGGMYLTQSSSSTGGGISDQQYYQRGGTSTSQSNFHIPKEQVLQPLSSSTGTCPLNPNDLQCISQKLNQLEWKTLGKFLGLSNSSLDNVEYDSHLLGDAECAFQMLLKWTQMNGSKATREILVDSLLMIDRTDLVEILFPAS